MTRDGFVRRQRWCVGAVLSMGIGLAAQLAPATAVAEVMQSGGAVIPVQKGSVCASNAGVCINTNEKAEGGAGDIDAIKTATISQETFSPLCQLTFTVVARGADYKNTFGWYAVQRDAQGKAMAPQLGDLHVFLGCTDAPGTQKTLTIPMGVPEIGFFLANNGNNCVATKADPLGPVLTAQPNNLFLSQRAFNSDGDGLIHLLVWQSRANPNAFYFGWEDQKGGGDNDFEDLLTYVTGIQCAGGGDACTVPDAKGVCADGVTQCRDGALTCVATQGPSDEVCNALDDDCDGTVDQGDDLCRAGEICVKGRCEPKCGTGEFRCGADEVCVEGVCLAANCADASCPDGSICVDGKCQAPCDGVTCPYGQACRSGVCVDVCEGVECDAGFVCEPRAGSGDQGMVGVCTSCDCRGCGDGQTCAEHLCVDDACVGVTCEAGQHCVAGSCVDGCDGAQCPSGQICQTGACVDDPNAGSGGAGSSDGGASAGGDDGGIIIDPGSGATSGSSGGSNGGGTSGQLGDDKVALEAKGCGCQTPGSPTSSGALWLAGLLVGAALRRRRARAI